MIPGEYKAIQFADRIIYTSYYPPCNAHPYFELQQFSRIKNNKSELIAIFKLSKIGHNKQVDKHSQASY